MMTLLDTSVSGLMGLPEGDSTLVSMAWFARARGVLAGGISSSARATATGDRPYPLYMDHGRGSRIWDADGNEFVDYLLSYGSLPLGHTDASLRNALVAQIDMGTMFGTCNTVEVELAEQVCRMVPCAELVRFANSGSEAICGAVRAARGFTGRDKILKFEGHYHGWVDVLAVSNRPSPQEAGPAKTPASCPHSRGIPAGVVADVVICPWNDLGALREILRRHGPELAAVIAEPVVANNACIIPVPGFLEALREECNGNGILLIFDEIVTGFRIAPGGAQELFGVVPDLAVYSKALGGGLPISAFAGRRAVMELVARNQVKHGGTYNGNPLCAAAALHTLRTLSQPGPLSRMRLHGQTLMETIRRAARDLAVPCVVQGLGAMFQVVFGLTSPPRDYRGLCAGDQKRYAAFRHALLRRGVHVNNSGTACWFNSAAHTADDLAITVDAIEHALRAIA
ncbi:MAG: glutamate-1-semialdehyde 2,1-aminomutase [Tepidisphaeraceae bacterium]|jgi:glutamate-1-semialdehyde 2,1-aminomutase